MINQLDNRNINGICPKLSVLRRETVGTDYLIGIVNVVETVGRFFQIRFLKNAVPSHCKGNRQPTGRLRRKFISKTFVDWVTRATDKHVVLSDSH